MTFGEYTESEKKKKKKKEQSFAEFTNEQLGRNTDNDIAPVKEENTGLFKAGRFADGKWDAGDLTLSLLGTLGDTAIGIMKGVGGLAEGLLDLGAYGVAGVADLLGADSFAEKTKEHAERAFVQEGMDVWREELGTKDASFFGDFGHGIAEGVGQVGAIILTGGAAGAAGASTMGASAITTGLIGASSMGSGMSEAYQSGATDEDAVSYGAMKGVIDAGTELIFGGLGKGVKALGISKGISSLDDVFAKKLSSKISNKFFANATEYGVKASAEGLEEVLAGIGSATAKKLTYMSDEELSQLIEDENLLEQFATGAIVSGIAQSGDLVKSTKSGRDFVTGLSTNEETVVEKVYNDRVAEEEKGGKKLSNKEKNKIYDQVQEELKRGEISIDEIESVLGGEKYKTYKDTVDSEDAILKEFAELGKKQNATLEEQARYAELSEQVKEIKANSKRNDMRMELSKEVFNSVKEKDGYLAESYYETSRRGQAFEADLSKYDAKQQEVVKKAIDAGYLNNTRKTHDLVDMIAKISADKGVSFDFANNAKLKESGFAVDGKTVNGYYSNGGITLNVESAKTLNTVVGHEVTHVLEGTEFYKELQGAIFEYAKAKKDYDGRRKDLEDIYKGVEDADIDSELTADLVGDYLFTDPDFINHLSATNRNLFQKIYDEVKYLFKIATKGSKEARELEKVKKAFEKAYREGGKAKAEAKSEDIANADTKYSVSVTDKDTIDFLENQEHITTYKSMQVIDGKLYPPMAAKVKGEDGKYRLNNPSELGKWQQATEDPSHIKKIKNGVGYYTLNKGDGTSIDAAYNPYEHSSNLVLNDQFESAHRRNNLVTVECVIPVSEMSSGYKAEYAKDGTGVMDWKSGVVAGQIKDNKRLVYLSRYLKPVRILSEAETAAKYKDILEGTGVSVPFNVVSPSLLAELEKAGVAIDYDGSPMYQSIQKRRAEKKAKKKEAKYSLTAEQQEYFKDSKVRDENGDLKVMYHGTSKGGHTVFDTYGSNYGLFGQGSYFTDNKSVAESYTKKGKGNNPQVYESYLNITNPMDMDAEADPQAWAKAFPDADFPESGTNEDFYRAMEEYFADEQYPKWEAAEEAMNALMGMGYDGITHIGGGRFNKADDTRHQVYIAFNPEQIKNIDNEKPTDNPDIRYSLSTDNEGTKLTKEQSEFFKDTKALDRNGNLLKVYHTTNNDFTVFDKSRKGEATGDSNTYLGFFFADDAEYMQNFPEFKNGKTEAYYLNITNPIDMTDISKEAFLDIVDVLGGDVQEAAEIYDQELSDEKDRAQLRGDNNTSLQLINLLNEMTGDADYHTLIDELKPHYNELMSRGYDGVVNYLDELWGAKEYIVLDSNQAKLTTNLKPTADPDIRYSLSEDSEGNQLSPAVKNRFSNSKAVDENGNLMVLYHGTPSGEFTIFDKSKGSVEGDFGSGFYFTNDEYDVSRNYDGGGPDFENKVERRAEQIEYEEEIDYDEAKEKAREELYKGSHKFEVYLNIENPAIVGETMLLTQESYLEEYNEEDYDDPDDYYGDVEQLVNDDIENIVWEVERNTDVSSTDEIANILYEAYYEGGIDIEELKNRINELYLEDSYGNQIGNEVTRQIIESLGYDGIIDNTVSTKFKNMGLSPSTTHYIVFKPNQIKAVTNQNPTDNPDIHRSLSANGKTPKTYGKWNIHGKDIRLENATEATAEDLAPIKDSAPIDEREIVDFPDDPNLYDLEAEESRQREALSSLTDEDAPPEIEAPYYDPDDSKEIDAIDPFTDREMENVGNRSVKAYMYENPEVKSFFQAEAEVLLGELQQTEKPETIYNGWLKYDMNYEAAQDIPEIYRTPRITTESIAYLRDSVGMSYADIEKGLNAIIEDNGAENIAAAKKIEFEINRRLLYGYNSWDMAIPRNESYVQLLKEKNITEYNEEARKKFFEEIESYAPIAEDDIAPTREYEAIKPRPEKLSGEEAQWAKNKMSRADKVKGEEQQTAKILVNEPETEKKKGRGWSKFVSNFVDKQSVFETLSLKTKNRELMAKADQMHRAESSAQWLIGNGTEGVKSLNDIRAEVESTGLTAEFYEYMYHKHNVDRMSLESKEKPNLKRLEKEMRNLKLSHLNDNQLKAIASEWITKKTTPKRKHLITTVREYLASKEIKNKPVFGFDVTAEESQEIVKQYEFATPEFKQYAEDVYAYMNHLRKLLVDNGVISQETANLWAKMYPYYVPIRRAGYESSSINVPLDTGRTGVNAPIKRATGGNRDILPLFDTMAMRTQQTYKAIAKNSFGVELKNTLGTTIESNTANLDEVIDSIDKHEELLQKGENGSNPTFTVFENGERVTFEITEEMYDALKPTSEFFASKNKVLNKVSNIRRGLITEYNPVFLATNAIKDVQDVLINSQHAASTYKNIPKAIKELATKGRWYQEYMENGGESNTYFDGESKTFTKDDTGIKKAIGIPLRGISKANNFIERAPRLAEYIASREAGASIEVAMLDAARVTTNFAAGGDVTKFLDRNGATFLNASMQGMAQQVRNVREAKANGLKGWLGLAGKFALAGLPAILLNHLLWEDDEDYEELSDYVKDNYYVVAKYGDGQFVRIPKGRTVAVIQEAFEQVGNAATGNDEADFQSFFELFVNNIAPNNPIDNNIFAPIIQVANNKTWYGEDLVPTRLQDLPKEEQYDESTDSLSRWLGETFGWSPYKVNYLLDQYSGGIGDVFLPMMTPEAESGDDSFGGNIIAPFKDKFTTDSVMNNQNVSDFYDTKDELAALANSINATDEDLLRYKYMNSVNSQLSELYAMKREVQNGNLKDSEKYAYVREIQKQIDALAEESLNSYQNVYIDGGYAIVGDRHYRRNDKGEWQKISDDQLDIQDEVTSALGITGSEYWRNKSEYDFAYEYPDKYAVAKAVGGYDKYKAFASDLSDIKADKDKNGKTISGSRKKKVLNYINSLDADYGEKIIMFKSVYNADDTYNSAIVEYLNSREDISYEEMVGILKELGFTVHSDGRVTW